MVTVLRALGDEVLLNGCTTVSLQELESVLQAYMPLLSDEDAGFLAFEQARILLQRGDTGQALTLMDQAWLATGDAGIPYLQANILAGLGEREQTLLRVEAATVGLEQHNNLETGTRPMKRQALLSLRQALEASN